MVPTQLVQMPWGFYPANMMQPQANPNNQPNQAQRQPSGQRPMTPGHQAQVPPQMASGDGSQQHQINTQQMQMPPSNYVDMNG